MIFRIQLGQRSDRSTPVTGETARLIVRNRRLPDVRGVGADGGNGSVAAGRSKNADGAQSEAAVQKAQARLSVRMASGTKAIA
jgi:hypothetical protein